MFMHIRTRSRQGSRLALLFALACLVTVSVPPVSSLAGTPEAVLAIETIGTGPVNAEDPSAAEQAAINNALELAINEVVATILPPEILADNFEEIMDAFYGGAEKFVLNYKKLAVAKGNDYCRVLVRTSILAGDIKKRIKQSGIVIDRDFSPRLLILLSEDRRGRGKALNTLPDAEKAMTENFTKRGITAVRYDRRIQGIGQAGYTAELNDQEAVEIGRSLGADFVITGKTFEVVSDNLSPDKTGNIQGVLDARLLDINTGSGIFKVSLQRYADDVETSSDARSALAAAGKAAARQFSPAIITAFEQQKSKPQAFQIRIQGAGYLANLNSFRNVLETIDRINRFQINEMKIDEAVISVDFPGSSRELARALVETPSDLITITVTAVLKNSVIIQLTTAGMAAD